jgi:integration host factor subunit beta
VAFLRLGSWQTMVKSEFIIKLTARQVFLTQHGVERVVNSIIKKMTDTLATGQRIEVRGFGVFSVITRKPRIGRNPKTGESVSVSATHTVRFKAGTELAKRVRDSADKYRISQ